MQLYAEYDQSRLLPFLRVSNQYSLDQAYEICKSRGLVKEQVYILSRMGNIHDALQLIIKELADIPQAIDFAKNQNDNELWDSLIDWAVGSASTTGVVDKVLGCRTALMQASLTVVWNNFQADPHTPVFSPARICNSGLVFSSYLILRVIS